MIKQIKSLLMDLDNTFYEYDPCNNYGIDCVAIEISKLFGGKKEDVYGIMMDARDRLKNDLGDVASSHSRLIYIQKTIEDISGKTNPELVLKLHEHYWQKYFEKMILYNGVDDMLKKANEKNVKTVIVTDHVADIQLRKLIKLGIDSRINYLASAEEAGVEKPHPKIFQLALQKAKCTPQECIMVGDELKKDIGGAKALGIYAIHAEKGNFVEEVMKYL